METCRKTYLINRAVAMYLLDELRKWDHSTQKA